VRRVTTNSDAISSLGAPSNVAQQSASVAITVDGNLFFFASGSAWSRDIRKGDTRRAKKLPDRDGNQDNLATSLAAQPNETAR